MFWHIDSISDHSSNIVKEIESDTRISSTNIVGETSNIQKIDCVSEGILQKVLIDSTESSSQSNTTEVIFKIIMLNPENMSYKHTYIYISMQTIMYPC